MNDYHYVHALDEDLLMVQAVVDKLFGPFTPATPSTAEDSLSAGRFWDSGSTVASISSELGYSLPDDLCLPAAGIYVFASGSGASTAEKEVRRRPN